MEADQLQLPRPAAESQELRAKQVFRDIVVERFLVRAHPVTEEPRLAAHEGSFQVLDGLAAKSPLHHHAQTPLQFVRLRLTDSSAAASPNEEFLEGRLVAQECSRTVDVLDERPHLAQ